MNARSPAALWAILCLAALFRVVPAIRRPLQVDEAYGLRVASLPAPQILHVLRQLDVHPPLYWLTLHVLLLLHVPDAVMRLLAALLGVAAVALLYAVVALWHGRITALIAAACAALMPSFIYYDVMIRMYVGFDVLALGSFAALSVLYTREDLSVRARRCLWVVWSLAIGALLYTQYLGFSVVAAHVLYAACVRRDGLVRCLAGAAVALVLWSPQLATFAAQYPAGGLAFPEYASHQLSAFFELIGQSTIAVQTHGAGPFVLATSIIGWIWLIAAVILGVPANGRSLAVWLCMPAVLTLIAGLVTHKLLYVDRYYLLLAYGLCALTGIAAQRLLAKSPHARAPLWAALAGLTAFGSLYAFVPAYYSADWPTVGSLIATGVHDGDLIVLDQGSSFFPLQREGALDRRSLALVLRHSDVEVVVQRSRPYRRIWLVVFQSGPVDPNARVFYALAGRMRPIANWVFERQLPAETVSIVLFGR